MNDHDVNYSSWIANPCGLGSKIETADMLGKASGVALTLSASDSEDGRALPPQSADNLQCGFPGRHRNGGEAPPPADAILLDILSSSIVSRDGGGKVQIAPDPPSLQRLDDARRDTAEHLVSWENGCDSVRDAIEHAVKWGDVLFDSLSSRYDDVLRDAGYDRSDPRVQESAHTLEVLHDATQRAREILDDLRIEGMPPHDGQVHM